MGNKIRGRREVTAKGMTSVTHQRAMSKATAGDLSFARSARYRDALAASRAGAVIVGSDLDRGVFDSYLADGLLDVSKHLTIYMSKYDQALGVSQMLTRRQRLGQMFGDPEGEMSRSGRDPFTTTKSTF